MLRTHEETRPANSVTGCDRSAPATKPVVKPHRDHIHVLADPVVDYGRKARIDRGERVVVVAHEQVEVGGGELLPAENKAEARVRGLRAINQSGPRMAQRGSQNSFTAAATPLEMMSWRSGDSICTSSSRLPIEPASNRTAGILVFLNTTSWS